MFSEVIRSVIPLNSIPLLVHSKSVCSATPKNISEFSGPEAELFVQAVRLMLQFLVVAYMFFIVLNACFDLRLIPFQIFGTGLYNLDLLV